MATRSVANRDTPEIATAQIVAQELRAARATVAKLLHNDANAIARFERVAMRHYSHHTNPDFVGQNAAGRMLAVDPRSYMLACVDALTDGLVPDGKMGAIIPRGKVAVWTPMWRGLLDLAKRGNPSLREIRAFVVYQIEIDKRAFVVDNARGIERHTPWQLLGLDYTPKDDDIACAYARAVVRDENGNESIEWRILWRANLIKRAERSANPNDKLWSPAWIQWFGEMAQAKAIRALCDMLTMPPAYLDAVERDDERQRASVSQIEDDAPLPPSNGKPGLAAEIRGAGVALAAGETAGEGSPS